MLYVPVRVQTLPPPHHHVFPFPKGVTAQAIMLPIHSWPVAIGTLSPATVLTGCEQEAPLEY